MAKAKSTGCKIEVADLKQDPNFKQCPRCRTYHACLLNHDALCDKCCAVLMDMFDNGLISGEIWANTIQAIRSSIKAQKIWYKLS